MEEDTIVVSGSDSDNERPERLLVVPQLNEGEETRYLLVRWPDWPHPALLSIAAPTSRDIIDEAVSDLIRARLRVDCNGTPRASSMRIPVRMAHPRFGGDGLGWLRPVAVRISDAPEPDALLEGVHELELKEALDLLPTEVERTVLKEASRLFIRD